MGAVTIELDALRSMLREEAQHAAGMGQARDLAIAHAVQAWYMQQFPHMRILIDQPDLAAIISKVRTPAPAEPPPPFSLESIHNGDHRWSDDELNVLLDQQRPAMVINKILPTCACTPEDKARCAECKLREGR